MTLVIIIIGLFFVGLGFLVKASPDLIAGYNTMSKQKKKNVDITGLSTCMRNGFIATGIALIICHFILKIFHLETFSAMVMLLVIFAGITITVVKAQKYDHNKRKSKMPVYIVLGVTFVFTAGIIAHSFMPTKVIFEEEKIEFTGSYGFELRISEIESVELADKIPAIEIRSNGVSIGNVHKGTFRLESWGRCRLLLNSKQPPFLIITKTDGGKIIFNSKDRSLTETVYNQFVLRIHFHNSISHIPASRSNSTNAAAWPNSVSTYCACTSL